ncbi:hypothetical protein [Azospirillum sp. B506]|uniref:hypothetical protein n=1 Tax=Azospirillum sp. B506 TaxID=137721 RepID=UPI0005B271C2|nr:hypothetical protein [Azospirillum sp. B506]
MRFLFPLLFGLLTLPVQAQDIPKPLGVPLGAGVSDVKAAFAGKFLEEVGENRFTNGPMFATSGTGFDVEDLNKVLLIFDRQERLAALQMTMGTGGFGKPAYDRVLGYLKSQYPVISSINPRVGDKKAVFEIKNARIKIDAPHMSFDMTVTYMAKSFHKSFTDTISSEKSAKRKSEASRF